MTGDGFGYPKGIRISYAASMEDIDEALGEVSERTVLFCRCCVTGTAFALVPCASVGYRAAVFRPGHDKKCYPARGVVRWVSVALPCMPLLAPLFPACMHVAGSYREPFERAGNGEDEECSESFWASGSGLPGLCVSGYCMLL